MLGYITLGTNDLDASSRFYDSLFAEINVGRIMAGSEEHGYVVWAKDNESTGFSVLRPHDGQPAQPGNGFYAAYFRGLYGNKLNAYCMISSET